MDVGALGRSNAGPATSGVVDVDRVQWWTNGYDTPARRQIKQSDSNI